MLNPDQNSFCLDSTTTSATLPIRINQTSPILIEILRFDLDNGLNETITILAKQARAMKKQADRVHPKSDFASPRYLHLLVKKTGLYRLHRVVDESNLEVQRRMSDTLIVSCPHASIKVVPPDKCKGELSDLVLDVYGTPPLKIKYSRVVNRDDKVFSFQSIQPENLDSPPNRQRDSDAPASLNNMDVSWARAQHIRVPLNESMNIAGRWVYSIDEVHDASGNVADYTSRHQTLELPKGEQLQQFFHVHERPRASLDTYESQCVLRVARGKGARFPIKIETEGAHQPEGPYPLSYSFTPLDKLQSNGEHEMGAKVEDFRMSTSQDRPILTSPGLYTLRSVSSQFCGGEVLEPASCLLTNPPQPNLSVSFENLFDKCAGNAIGLRVDLDLIGTPPFQVQYDVLHKNHGKAQVHTIRVDGLRHQIEFRPREAGRHIYTFRSIEDSVYDQRPLVAKNTVLEQDVKPPASAHFTSSRPKKHACIEEPVSFDVRLQGEGPWDLEYELVHAGKRKKKRISGIEQEIYTIKTDNLVDGGEYVVALTSIQDRSGCKIFVNDEARIDVRQQRPKVSFGHLEGQRSTLTLEDQLVRLPIRLIGESPWTIKYRNLKDSPSSIVHEKVLRNKNDFIEVRQQGKYELLDVHDDACPGTVARTANQFEVFWIERPDFRLSDNVLVERIGDAYVKKQVCEGDEDTVEMSLVGTPPYYVKYEQRIKPQRGGVSYSNKEFTAGLGVASIRMETSQAGLLEYRFSELGDHLYTHDSRKRQPLVIRQQVNPRPAALFMSPGKTYRYCKEEEAGDELIPIALEGTPPFYLELDIKHHSSPRPEIVRIPNIVKNTFEFRIPHRVLTFGNHVVTVRNVRDAHGCNRKTEFETPRVQVMVSNVPAISSMESREDYCIGDRISYTLSGTPPFQVFYSFEGNARRATSIGTTFRRIADSPGNYTITSIGDHASDCKARTKITKLIHPMPSVKINKGRETEVGIHEGGEAQLSFEFWGTPPFEFTYVIHSRALHTSLPAMLTSEMPQLYSLSLFSQPQQGPHHSGDKARDIRRLQDGDQRLRRGDLRSGGDKGPVLLV